MTLSKEKEKEAEMEAAPKTEIKSPLAMELLEIAQVIDSTSVTHY